jgi:Tol biopolymer transport system component
VLNLATGEYAPWQTFPAHIVTYPRYSPDGLQLAYILMPDTNIPFTIGELWLADGATGEPLSLLDQVDAGHGYPPVWSPDGDSLAYVRRENVDVARADFDPAALRSNLYQVDVSSGDIAQLTGFPDSLVYDPVWAPNSDWLAFTADDAVWLLPPGAAPIQVSPPGIARHPAWLTLTSP